MLVGLTADTVPLGSEETIDRDIDAWALGLHDCPVECAYIVQVDVDREPVETEVEAVERRPALEDEPLRQERVAGDLLQQVQEPQHLFERAELVASWWLVWCLTNTLTNLRVLLAVGCVALPRVVHATARHRALPTTKMPSHLHNRICETPH